MDSNKIQCPLVNGSIEDYECLEISDCADGLIKDEVIPDRFKEKDDWKDTCLKCPNHKE